MWSANTPWKFGSTMPCSNGLSGMWIRYLRIQAQELAQDQPEHRRDHLRRHDLQPARLERGEHEDQRQAERSRAKKTFGSILRNCDGRLGHDAPELVGTGTGARPAAAVAWR